MRKTVKPTFLMIALSILASCKSRDVQNQSTAKAYDEGRQTSEAWIVGQGTNEIICMIVRKPETSTKEAQVLRGSRPVNGLDKAADVMAIRYSGRSIDRVLYNSWIDSARSKEKIDSEGFWKRIGKVKPSYRNDPANVYNTMNSTTNYIVLDRPEWNIDKKIPQVQFDERCMSTFKNHGGVEWD